MSKFAFSCYKPIIEERKSIMSIGDVVPIPKFTADVVRCVINEAKTLLKEGTPLVYSKGDVVIVGDIHGSIHDMFSIFAYFGYPPETSYLFLGDYVDRGEFSLEVMTFLLTLYSLYPQNVILLRGNHEFEGINKVYGFKKSIEREYKSDELWKDFNECFEYLPIACLVGDSILCLHGGISSNFTSVNILRTMEFPIQSNNVIISDITWSDPMNLDSPPYMKNERGLGQKFGRLAFEEFLTNSKITTIIRGHECVDGILTRFNGRLITVFSSSNYGMYSNRCGALYVSEDNEINYKVFPRLPKILKEDSFFFNVIRPQNDTNVKLKKIKSLRRHSFNLKSDHVIINPTANTLIKHKSLSSHFHLPKAVAII